ncbi:hypothetical protein SLEP1_g47404 [Rubroshorea leprosula]|uniref:Uncharacterized protein n=1 Tax=Rubroshorea leprosula TaxID=152421 RepID=A0AAV5LQD7_9ROSI|nr:hypothetical protein SLEP1_g47404 [Rubroshorea leprosula]
MDESLLSLLLLRRTSRNLGHHANVLGDTPSNLSTFDDNDDDEGSRSSKKRFLNRARTNAMSSPSPDSRS